MKSSEQSKTLRLCNKASVCGWKRLYTEQPDDAISGVLRKDPGRSISQRTMLKGEKTDRSVSCAESGIDSREQDRTLDIPAYSAVCESVHKESIYERTKWKSVSGERAQVTILTTSTEAKRIQREAFLKSLIQRMDQACVIRSKRSDKQVAFAKNYGECRPSLRWNEMQVKPSGGSLARDNYLEEEKRVSLRRYVHRRGPVILAGWHGNVERLYLEG